MKALVTGAHGFIGSHLCEALLAEGAEVKALVSPWGNLGNLSAILGDSRLTLLRADITDSESLRGSCEGAQVVFHAAARVADWGPWEAFYKTNVKATEYLLREAERAGVKRLVLVSSVAVHRYTGFTHADPRKVPTDGDINAYARSKVLAEKVVMAGGLEPVIVRPGLWPFGARNPEFRQAVGALKRGLLPLVDGGQAVINTAYVENLVHGLILAGTVPQAAGKIYLIADEGRISWRELFGELAEVLGAPQPRLSVPGSLLEPLGGMLETAYATFLPGKKPPLSRYGGALMRRSVHFSTIAAQEELGYAPEWRTREGLARSVAGLENGFPRKSVKSGE